MTPNKNVEIEFDDPELYEDDDFDPYAEIDEEDEFQDEDDYWTSDDDLRSLNTRW